MSSKNKILETARAKVARIAERMAGYEKGWQEEWGQARNPWHALEQHDQNRGVRRALIGEWLVAKEAVKLVSPIKKRPEVRA